MSVTTGCPVISSPKAKASFEGKSWNISLSKTLLNDTDCDSLLGTSIPTAAFPGIGASIRIPDAAKFNAISSAKFTILLTFTPWLGESSYLVTVGPLLICITFASTPKLFNVVSNFLALWSISDFDSLLCIAWFLLNKSIGGNTYCGICGTILLCCVLCNTCSSLKDISFVSSVISLSIDISSVSSATSSSIDISSIRFSLKDTSCSFSSLLIFSASCIDIVSVKSFTSFCCSSSSSAKNNVNPLLDSSSSSAQSAIISIMSSLCFCSSFLSYELFIFSSSKSILFKSANTSAISSVSLCCLYCSCSVCCFCSVFCSVFCFSSSSSSLKII